MKRDTKRNIFVIAILLVLLFGCISTSNFSHADSGFDTGYSGGGGYSGGSYSDSSDYDFSGGSGGIHLLAFIVMAIILIIREIYRSIERSQIKSGLEKQKELDKKYDGLSDEDIWKIDKTLSLEILTLTAKSAYEKYAKNINKPNRLQSIFTDELKEKFDFEANKNRVIENIEFVDIKILELKSDDYIEFKAYYIVKCNDYTNIDNKDVECYNKIIFTLVNLNDLWLIKDIKD